MNEESVSRRIGGRGYAASLTIRYATIVVRLIDQYLYAIRKVKLKRKTDM